MKTIGFYILMSLLSISVFSQQNDGSLVNIPRNNFGIGITQSSISGAYETTVSIFGLYEKKLSNSFSLFSRLGVGEYSDKFGDYPDYIRVSLHGYASTELRYYFTIHRRIKKQKPVNGFAYPYFSVEQNIFSNHFALMNMPKKDAFVGSTRTFINFGYQKVMNKLFLGVYLGSAFTFIDFNKSKFKDVEMFHIGFTAGLIRK